MTERTPSTPARAESTIGVSEELRDRLRVEKAKEGVTYDEYLRENLSLEME